MPTQLLERITLDHAAPNTSNREYTMGTDAGFVQYVCDQLRGVSGVSYKKMFGEYAVYVDGKVVALACDNQLFLKPTEAARALLGSPVEAPPYPGAKPYLLLNEHLDSPDLLSELFRATAAALPAPRPKKSVKNP